jgi:hypothetical protein
VPWLWCGQNCLVGPPNEALSQLQLLGDAWNDRGEEEEVFSMVIEEFQKQEVDMMTWLHMVSPAGYILQ